MQLSGVHIESNGSDCFTNITIEQVQSTALALGIPGIVCLLFSIAGLVAELVFLCRIKNNFLLRLFLYLSVAVSMTLGVYSLHLHSYWDQSNKPICAILDNIQYYLFTVEQLLIFSTNIVLLYKVYSTVFRPCGCARTDSLNKFNRFIEFLFILIHIGIPMIAAIIHFKYQNHDNKAFSCYTRSDNQSVTECDDQQNTIHLEFEAEKLIQILINLILSIVCITVLLIWLIWLQSRHFLRARMKTVSKEIGLWFGYLISYCFFWTIVFCFVIKHIQFFPLYAITQIVIPISFFVYVCVNVQYGRIHEKRSAHEFNCIDPHTTGLQTAPPSTRISLPSDTAAHAPNFLSPEELSEVTPLINN